jgi:hypothetical protein
MPAKDWKLPKKPDKDSGNFVLYHNGFYFTSDANREYLRAYLKLILREEKQQGEA